MRFDAALFTHELGTVTTCRGPLVFIERAEAAHLGEVVEVIAPDGATRSGQVLEVAGDRAVIEVFEGTRGLDLATTVVRLGTDVARIGVGRGLLGRMFDGSGQPIDGGPPLMAEQYCDVNGSADQPGDARATRPSTSRPACRRSTD